MRRRVVGVGHRKGVHHWEVHHTGVHHTGMQHWEVHHTGMQYWEVRHMVAERLRRKRLHHRAVVEAAGYVDLVVGNLEKDLD